ncbi:MAG TPA: hypothetical protein VNB49_17260, partial [Candidatus Dormibacteraeota bacterium]|nr:hypothetical protein [Candidatus Dormibacteraeota bacterium]
ALSEAYEQVNTLATDDTLHRLVRVLLKMATKLGQGPGQTVEIPTGWPWQALFGKLALALDTS